MSDLNVPKSVFEALAAFGLKDEEIRIYLSLLNLGEALLTDIAREIGANRTTLYPYMDRLMRFDLIRKSIKGKRIAYMAQDPAKIMELKKRQDRLLDNALPKLQELFQESGTSALKVISFDGLRAMRKLYDEMSQETGYLYSIFSPKELFEIFNENDGVKFLKNVEKNGIDLKELVPDDEDGRLYAQYGYTPLLGKPFKFKKRPVRLLEKTEVLNDILISYDKTAFISYKSQSAVLIKDRFISQTHKNIFERLWQSAKNPN